MEHDLVAAFAALAHPQRLGVVRLLFRHYPRSVPAGEIGAVLGVKPSTLSGYLAQLVESGLILQARRGTSLLYTASTDGIDALNQSWIGSVCRGRGLPENGSPGSRVRNIVFVGFKNAGPTLIAEALLRAEAGEWYEVFSAGVEVGDAEEADVLAYLQGVDIDVEPLWAKSIDDLVGPGAPRMDVVVTLGERALAGMPDFAGCPLHAHWVLPGDLNLAHLHAYLAKRLKAFAALDPAQTSRTLLQEALDAEHDNVVPESDLSAASPAAQA